MNTQQLSGKDVPINASHRFDASPEQNHETHVGHLKSLPYALILEDDSGIQFIYRETLSSLFQLQFAANIEQLENLLQKPDYPDLLIADITLPDGTFTQFLSQGGLTERLKQIPILVVSMIDELSTIEHFLSSAHCDYLTKPFNRNELIAKLRRLMAPLAEPQISINHDTLRVKCGSIQSEPLTATELKIFHMLSNSSSGSRSRKEMMEQVWGETDQNKKLEVSISRLRRKLLPLGVSVHFIEPDAYKIMVGAPASDRI